VTGLSDAERACLGRFVAFARERLGERLVLAVPFGSAARGEMWPAGFPIHSDFDVLLVVDGPVDPADRDALVDATYPLFLECGRQISPALLPVERWEHPAAGTEAELVAAVRRDGVELGGD
jgi:predicted nucleotidyltransferase